MTKDQGITVSISTVGSILASLGAVWVFAAPIAQRALAGEITEQVKPLNDAFMVILVQNIQSQKNTITAMEFKRDMCSEAVCWTLRDAQDLQAAKDALQSMQKALSGMQESKR